MKITHALLGLGMLALSLTSGCSNGQSQTSGASSVKSQQILSTISIDLKGQSFTVEVARTPEEHKRGLQGRAKLGNDQGMLFVYEQEQPLNFWMKDTLIGLDILFFDREGRFINGHYQVPPCKSMFCTNYGSTKPAQFVVELESGRGQGLELEPGDTLGPIPSTP